MKQRLGVAAALLGEPDLLVLDEPTNGLDPAGMADMRALLVDLAAGGQTVLLSSHLLAEVQEICDRVGVIAGGRLLVESTVAELRGGDRVRLRAPSRWTGRWPSRCGSPGTTRSRCDGDGAAACTARPRRCPSWPARWSAPGSTSPSCARRALAGGGLLRPDPDRPRRRRHERARREPRPATA